MLVKVWVNGELLDASDAQVAIFDHGLTVGDGVFEAVKVIGGVPFAITRHLRRLRRSALGLGLGEPELAEIRSGVAEVVESAGRPARARIRITVTGGHSPLGSERGAGPRTAVVALEELGPAAPIGDVVVVPWSRNEHGALAGLKTTSYAENVRALGYARERGALEAIFGNTAGNLCEGTGTNVFLVTAGTLVTPPLSAGCLAGVTRGLVLEWYGGEERDVPLGALAAADEAFLTSTMRDLQAIRGVDGKLLPAAPGPVTRKAAEVFAQRAAENPDP
ncbi:MAG TPA: aminotransferase class IV [Streptosporangiaceae bacterium]|nr:aminotransferase class IV [Streptosporangiaceae bacterium]